MRDLFIYIRDLLLSDPEMKRLFLKAGYDAVSVIQPDQRTGAKYPRVILDTEESTPDMMSDNAPPKFINGRVMIEIVAATDEARQVTPIAMRKDLTDRCRDLLLGDGELPQPLQGQRFVGASGKRWCVTQCRLVKSRRLSASDPLFSRGDIVFSVQLCKN